MEILGDTFEDSLWGIDDLNHADEIKEEIALAIAHQLERVGYTITDKPDHRARCRQAAIDRIKRNAAEQCWAA